MLLEFGSNPASRTESKRKQTVSEDECDDSDVDDDARNTDDGHLASGMLIRLTTEMTMMTVLMMIMMMTVATMMTMMMMVMMMMATMDQCPELHRDGTAAGIEMEEDRAYGGNAR